MKLFSAKSAIISIIYYIRLEDQGERHGRNGNGRCKEDQRPARGGKTGRAAPRPCCGDPASRGAGHAGDAGGAGKAPTPAGSCEVEGHPLGGGGARGQAITSVG